MITLRKYQDKIVNAVRSLMAMGKRRICAVAPCGSGKTAIFAYMADKSQDKGNTVWFLVHRKELLDQTIAPFDRFGIQRKYRHLQLPDFLFPFRLKAFADSRHGAYCGCADGIGMLFYKLNNILNMPVIPSLALAVYKLRKPIGKLSEIHKRADSFLSGILHQAKSALRA